MSQPAFHALCNGTALVLLVLGRQAVLGRAPFAARGRDERLHRALMLAAVVVSAVFLASYLHYHGRVGSVPFPGTGWRRGLYLVVLVPHVVLAAAMVPLILATLHAAFSDRRDRHRRLARWTWPIWVYVSISGVAVYAMLYHWAGATA